MCDSQNPPLHPIGALVRDIPGRCLRHHHHREHRSYLCIHVLYKADIYVGWITIERVHRLSGIGIYFSALWILFVGFQYIMRVKPPSNSERPMGLPVWLPLCWYLTGAAGVPLANLLFQQGTPLLVEHLLTVFILAPFVWGLAVWCKRLLTTAWHYACLPYRAFIER